MCGICGAWDRQNDPAIATVRMRAKMQHRGPDDEGLWTHSHVALGHRRLSIVDLSVAGHQPMVTDDGALVSVTNGEIYNYPELRRELEARGARFRSNSDSEIVLHAYRAYGRDAFSRLNGMYAFALYDVAADRLFVVRDRQGIKPIYYLDDKQRGRVLFASEIKAIVAAADRSRWQIDPEGLSQYLRFENLIGSKSMFAHVAMVEPGQFLEIGRHGLSTHTYWKPQLSAPAPVQSFSDATERFRESFCSAVRNHLMSDVPVACYLSSGFDSSLVTSQAARLLPEPPLAFNGYFAEGGWYDETSGARMIAEHVGVPMREVPIGARDFSDSFDDVVWALDEPRMGTGAFSQFVVARAAAAERKVILTGHGGDELFSGYPVFKTAAVSGANGLSAMMKALGAVRTSELPHILYFLSRRVASGSGATNLPLLFSDTLLRQALDGRGFEAVSHHRTFAGIEDIAQSANSDYERILLTYLKVYLPGLLVVEDKISMAHSLEARTPFLDNGMVDLALSIDAATKLHGGELKAIIKSAARDSLPSGLFALPKRGFPTPLSSWLRGSLSGWLQSRLTGQDSSIARLMRPEFLEHAVRSYLTSWRKSIRPLDEIQTHRIWMLLCLESWIRQTEEKLGVRLEL